MNFSENISRDSETIHDYKMLVLLEMLSLCDVFTPALQKKNIYQKLYYTEVF